jgi:hypothetical protein
MIWRDRQILGYEGKDMNRPRGTGRIYLQKRSSMWWIQYYRKGVMYRESTRTSDKGKATRLLILRLAAVTEETILEAEFERVRVAELAEDFFREARNNGMPAVDAEARWRLHLEPFFGPLRARQIADHWVDEYIYKRQQSGAANTTINREPGILRRMFNLAYSARQPKVSGVPKFRLLPVTSIR